MALVKQVTSLEVAPLAWMLRAQLIVAEFTEKYFINHATSDSRMFRLKSSLWMAFIAEDHLAFHYALNKIGGLPRIVRARPIALTAFVAQEDPYRSPSP